MMDKTKVAKKVLHLLRLSQNNPNENEAKAAGEMAVKLIEKYGLTGADMEPLLDEQRHAAAPSPRRQQPVYRQPVRVVRVVVQPAASGWVTYSTTGSSVGGDTTSTSSTTSSWWRA